MNDSNEQALRDITRNVMNLFDAWRLSTQEMHDILCMPKEVRVRKFQQFRQGDAVFPDDQKVLRRASYMLRIAEALRTTYPLNPEMSGRWIRQPHRRFGRRSPLTIILEASGDSGLIAVLSELDCTFSWDMTGSSAVTH